MVRDQFLIKYPILSGEIRSKGVHNYTYRKDNQANMYNFPFFDSIFVADQSGLKRY